MHASDDRNVAWVFCAKEACGVEFFGQEQAASSIESGNEPCALVTTYVPSKSVAKKFS